MIEASLEIYKELIFLSMVSNQLPGHWNWGVYYPSRKTHNFGFAILIVVNV